MVAVAVDLSHIHEALRAFAVPIDMLVLDDSNPNSHDDEQIESIMATLSELGQDELLIFRPDGRMVTHGNGRLIAARRLVEGGDVRWRHIAAFPIEEDDLTAQMRSVAHNALPRRSTFNHDVLARIAKAVTDAKRNIAATGLDKDAVQRLMERMKGPQSDPPVSSTRQVRFTLPRRSYERLIAFLKTFDDDRDQAFQTWLTQSLKKAK